jgi:hypothetical protein
MLVLPLAFTFLSGCQKMKRPELGDYPKDNPTTPTTALRFYLPFDSTSEQDKQINLRFKDSISQYPSFFPASSVSYGPGVRGTAYMGDGSNSLTYLNTNDWGKSSSFTVAYWLKHNGSTGGDAEFLMSVPSTQGHWSNSGMLLILDNTGAGTTATLAVFKLMVAEIGNGDHWFETTGANRVPGVLDNKWHQMVWAYDEATSNMNLYVDGALLETLSWSGHGPIKMDYTKWTGFYLGGKTTDWGKPFVGGIDQVRLYNKALSAAEVQALYTNKQ